MKINILVLLLCLLSSCKTVEKAEEEIELVGLEVAKQLIEDEIESVKR